MTDSTRHGSNDHRVPTSTTRRSKSARRARDAAQRRSALSGPWAARPERLEVRTLLTALSTQISVKATPQSYYGDPEILSATVLAYAPGAGSLSSTTQPKSTDGVVAFFEGTKSLGEAALSNSYPPTATLNVGGLQPGNHEITATYSGDSNFFPSQSPVGANSVVSQVPTQAVVPTSLAADANDNVYMTDPTHGTVVEVTPAGKQTVLFSGLNNPTSVAVDNAGSVYVSDGPTMGAEVHILDPHGNRSLLTYQPTVFLTTGGVTTPIHYGLPRSTFYNITGIVGISVDASYNVFLALTDGVYEVTKDGSGFYVAGPETDSQQKEYANSFVTNTEDPRGDPNGIEPVAVAPDNSGGVWFNNYTYNYLEHATYISPGNFAVTRVSPLDDTYSGATTTLLYNNLAEDGYGNLFIGSGGHGGVLEEVASGGTPVLINKEVDNAVSIASDGAGTLFVLDQTNNSVYEVEPGSANFTVLPPHPTEIALAASTANLVQGQVETLTATITPSDGTTAGPTTGTVTFYDGAALLGTVLLSGSSTATLYTTALGGGVHQITARYVGSYVPFAPSRSVVTPTSVLSVVPTTGVTHPDGVAVDGSGDVFLSAAPADPTNPANNHVIEVKPDGTQAAVGPAINGPSGVAADGSGHVFVTDADNRVVKSLSAAREAPPAPSCSTTPPAWRSTPPATSSSPTP